MAKVFKSSYSLYIFSTIQFLTLCLIVSAVLIIPKKPENQAPKCSFSKELVVLQIKN